VKRAPDPPFDDAEDAPVSPRERPQEGPGGDPDRSFRQLFDCYHRPLWRFFARRGCPPDQCDDLTQETFLRVYTSRDGFRGEARFETWLYRIAINSHRKWLRYGAAQMRAANEVPLETPDGVRAEAEAADTGFPSGAQVNGGPLEQLLADERRRTLAAAIDGLPDQMRRCVLLRLYHGLAYKEIAVVMQVSIETVKAHLFQARKRLRDELAGHFESVEL
jgi:RNA polymerase sigma-70 factor (ECF subfamily)